MRCTGRNYGHSAGLVLLRLCKDAPQRFRFFFELFRVAAADQLHKLGVNAIFLAVAFTFKGVALVLQLLAVGFQLGLSVSSSAAELSVAPEVWPFALSRARRSLTMEFTSSWVNIFPAVPFPSGGVFACWVVFGVLLSVMVISFPGLMPAAVTVMPLPMQGK